MAIRYSVNYKKAIETILWLATQKPNIDIYRIGKTIFYAEKFHLNKYGRPVIGDTYQKGPYGPFPSTIRDAIQQNLRWLPTDYLQESEEAFEVVKDPYPTPIPKREPDNNIFSKTDIECLVEALEIVGDMSFDELKNMTHEEESFLASIKNNEINYELLIDEGNPLRNDIIDEIRETNRYVCL